MDQRMDEVLDRLRRVEQLYTLSWRGGSGVASVSLDDLRTIIAHVDELHRVISAECHRLHDDWNEADVSAARHALIRLIPFGGEHG